MFPDSNAHGLGEAPQWLYTVRFTGAELWGEDADPTLTTSIDAWDSYLEPGEASSATTGQVAPVSRDGDGGPVFEAPWQANAFAVTLALHQRGVFTWTEWASTLAAEIKRATAAGDPGDGSTYYRHWLSAIERLVVDTGVVTFAHLDARRAPGTVRHARPRTPSRSCWRTTRRRPRLGSELASPHAAGTASPCRTGGRAATTT